MNPANLRWKKLLESLREDHKDDEKMMNKIDGCMESLAKFPLALLELHHCAMLKHFGKPIMAKMQLKMQEETSKKTPEGSQKPSVGSQSSPDPNLKQTSSGSQETSGVQLQKTEKPAAPLVKKPSFLDDDSFNAAAAMISVTPPRAENVSSRSWEDDDCMELIGRSSTSSEKQKSLEDEDYHFACQLSQELNEQPFMENLEDVDDLAADGDISVRRVSIKLQEEKDFLVALQLSQELNSTEDEDLPDLPSPDVSRSKPNSRFPYDQEEEDYRLALKLSQEQMDKQRPFDHLNKESFIDKPFFDTEKDEAEFSSAPTPLICQPRNSSSSSSSSSSIQCDRILARADSASSDYAPMIKKAKAPCSSNSMGKRSDPMIVSSESLIEEGSQAFKPSTQAHLISSDESEDDGESFWSKETKVKTTARSKKKSEATSKGQNEDKYLPKPGSGNYAILMGLLEESEKVDYKGYLSKQEVCQAASKFSDTGMTFSSSVVGPKSWYSAWSNSSKLVEKSLMKAWSNPKKYHLTEAGIALAKKLRDLRGPVSPQASVRKCEAVQQQPPDIAFSDSGLVSDGFFMGPLPKSFKIESDDDEEEEKDAVGTRVVKDVFIMTKGSYDILMLVDALEVTGGGVGGKKSRKGFTLDELQSLEVPFEQRRISVGDFAWIARHKYSSRELMLPYVVERKRLDDLRSSIMDGRYKEQKARLLSSGLSKIFYLVEYCGNLWSDSNAKPPGGHLDIGALEQAMCSTSVRDGLVVIRSSSQKESVQLLAAMTKSFIEFYRDKDLQEGGSGNLRTNRLISFSQFQEKSRPDKPLTARELFCNMLITQKGVSPDMAWHITSQYPTLASLKKAYDRCPDEDSRQTMLAKFPYGQGKRIPSSVSTVLYRLFSGRQLFS